MINKVILIGRLTKDIELRTSNKGTVSTFFTLAVNNNFSNANASTNFIACTAFNNVAENMNKFLKKGSLISVEGSLNSYRKEDGLTNLTVNVRSVDFLEPRYQNNSNENLKSDNLNNENENKESKADNNSDTFSDLNEKDESVFNEEKIDWD